MPGIDFPDVLGAKSKISKVSAIPLTFAFAAFFCCQFYSVTLGARLRENYTRHCTIKKRQNKIKFSIKLPKSVSINL